jgi:hypothetical protein
VDAEKRKKKKKKKKKISLVDDFFFFFFFFFHHLIHFSGGTSRFDCLSVGQTVTVMETTHTCTANMILSQETRNKVVRVLDRLKREVGNQLSIVRADRLALRDSYPWCWDESIDMRSRYGTSAQQPAFSRKSTSSSSSLPGPPRVLPHGAATAALTSTVVRSVVT